MKIKTIRDLGYEYTYDVEVEEVHEYILGNGCVSHNTSSLYLPNGTEGVEPIKDYIVRKLNDKTYKQVAPELRELRTNYQLAFEIPNEVLFEHAKIRQMFIDQAQSINTYVTNPDSAFDIIMDIINAYNMGLKTLYYSNANIANVCESCV